MLETRITRQFKRDSKRDKKRGKDFSKLKAVIDILINEQSLPFQYRDHALIGEYSGDRECHLEPDWLLIYRVESEALTLVRLGTHADLFE
jgi:mRNA interferase YafQ